MWINNLNLRNKLLLMLLLPILGLCWFAINLTYEKNQSLIRTVKILEALNFDAQLLQQAQTLPAAKNSEQFYTTAIALALENIISTERLAPEQGVKDLRIGKTKLVLTQEKLALLQHLVKNMIAEARYALLSTISVALLSILGAWYFILHISRQLLTTINSLSTATQQINSGNYAVQIKIATNDELGDLANNFNGMANCLATARQELEHKAQDLYMVNKYRSEFMANMSHELRTPLNSLLLFAQSLLQNKKNNLTTDQLDAVAIIKSAGGDLLILINDILDLSKVEAGKLDLYIEPVNLRKIISRLQQQFSLLAREKGLDLKIEFASAVPEVFNTDGNRLMQILRNLLANALKFTEHGSVIIRVFIANQEQLDACQTLSPTKLCLGFMVQDTGIGIAADQLTEIFGAFQQGDGGISRKFGGTGLGLTIAKSMGTLLHGEIIVTSTQGQGSEFTFFLQEQDCPIQAADTANFANTTDTRNISLFPTDDQQKNAIFSDKTVLVVDDNLYNTLALSRILTAAGLKIIAADNGASCLQKLAQHAQIDLILMDIMLPIMDGLQAMLKIRAQDKYKKLPIIALTAQAMQGYKEKCLASGANAYLAKPIDTQALMCLLQRHLHQT